MAGPDGLSGPSHVDTVGDVSHHPEHRAPSTDPVDAEGLVDAGAQLPRDQPQPPSEAVTPLVFLAIEQALEDLNASRDPVVTFLLGYVSEEQKGMWRLPDADEDQVRTQLALLEPRPRLAVSLFDAALDVDGAPRDAFVIEAFDAEEQFSSTVIQLYTPATPEAEATVDGAPQIYANGENVIRD